MLTTEEKLRILIDTGRAVNPVLDNIDTLRVVGIRDSIIEGLKSSDHDHGNFRKWDAWNDGLCAAYAAAEKGFIEYLAAPCGYLIPKNGKWEFTLTDEDRHDAIPVYTSPASSTRPAYVADSPKWWHILFGINPSHKPATKWITHKDASKAVLEEHEVK